jgi:hypothetical protein
LVYGAIALAIIGFGVFTQAEYYADFDTYVYYLDGLVNFPSPSWMYFEPLSNIYLLSAYWLTKSVLPAVIVAHYILGIIFLLAIVRVFPPAYSSWQTLLFTFAILGPLLAFVTLRATPAYFLVALAVSQALERRPTAWLYLLAASLFHISSLLAAAPMALLYFERNLPRFLRSKRSRWVYAFLAVVIIATATFLPNITSTILDVVGMFPAISKYDVYANTQTTETSTSHYLFLAFMLTFAVVYIIFQESDDVRINVYIISSLIIYILMFFSALGTDWG